ncbi:MAG: hypothetical protein ACRCZF_11385, partial [Gemmataceae bacterium]
QHPRLRSLLARTLVLLPQQQRGRSYGDTPQLPMVPAFALIDPETAQHLLRSMKSAEQIVKEGTYPVRDWLFAVAFADPVRGQQLLDKVFLKSFGTEAKNDANTKRYDMSFQGISELSLTLGAADRYAQLRMWLQLAGENF